MKSTRGVPIAELPLGVRERFELGPNSPLRAATFDEKAAEKARRGRTRALAGAGFESELKLVHQLYLARGLGRIERIEAPARWDRKARAWKKSYGEHPVDFLGIARIRDVPYCVAFDAKSWDEPTYSHDVERLHQLRTLLEFQKCGAIAFLLIRDRHLRLAYLVWRSSVLEELARGATISLRRARFAGKGSGRRVKGNADAFDHFFPVTREYGSGSGPRPLLVAQDVPQWDWLGVLESLAAHKHQQQHQQRQEGTP